MNRSIVRFLIAKLLLIEAALLVVPLIVALIYQEDAKVFASIGYDGDSPLSRSAWYSL